MSAAVNIIERIMARIVVDDETGCWLWPGSLKNGYGELRVMQPRRYGAYVHRVMFEYHHRRLTRGELVMHTCDVKRCCNPAHLTAGDVKANMMDAIWKGRPVGSKRSRIMPAVRNDVLARRAAGESYLGIARSVGLSRATVKKIVQWDHEMKMREAS